MKYVLEYSVELVPHWCVKKRKQLDHQNPQFVAVQKQILLGFFRINSFASVCENVYGIWPSPAGSCCPLALLLSLLISVSGEALTLINFQSSLDADKSP